MSRIDRAFERWCRRGDARALEQLFDATAPRLLRLGVHLVGDAAEAEDLVQAVFVSLIEGRERIDGARPAWPWLTSVLARRAVDARRRAGRIADRDDERGRPALELVAEDASAPSERRELAAELARALDRIDEPYRQPLVLRLRHGLSAAEIAHALGRSPATVRVQLHRGREHLRLLLPASLAGGLALIGVAPRGLAVLKSAVMSEAAGTTAVASAASITTLATGVTLVSHKAFAAVALCAALAVLLVLKTREQSPDAEQAGEMPIESAPSLAPVLVAAPPTAEPLVEVRSEIERDAIAAVRAVRGRVLDARTGAPIEGARIALYAPQELAPLDALRANPELFRSDPDGRVRPREGGDWPYLEDVSDLARLGRAKARIYGQPAAGALPLARATSDADGRYEIPAEVGGVLRCEHDGYVSRTRAARSLERAWDIELHGEQVLEGVVVTEGLEPPGVPLRLAFCARRLGAAPSVTDGSSPTMLRDEDLESLGTWTTECAADGRFSVVVGAEEVVPSVLTPGWSLGMRRTVRVDEELRLYVEPVPVLRVFDAASGVPIERVHLQGRESANGYVLWSGVFEAPGGLLELPGAEIIVTSWGKEGATLVAWADGYGEARLTFAAIGDVRLHEVPLERGTPPSLSGSLLRDGRPVRGASIALLGHSLLQWNGDEDHLLEACRTDGAGGFLLKAPAGRYVLRAEHEGTRYFELVELPREDPLVIDLARGGRVEVAVVDEAGEPRAGHTVALQSADGRGESASSDAEGRVEFTDLAPQSYLAFTTLITGETSFGADLEERFELGRGERRELRFVLPRHDGPRRLSVRAGGERSYEGWTARADSGEWLGLSDDGTLVQDLATMHYTFEVQASDGRGWSLRVPRGARDGEVVELCAGTARIVGSWLDSQGRPLAGWGVYALPLESPLELDVTPSIVTDDDGAFEIGGLDASRHALLFRVDREGGYDFSTDGIYFAPDEPAGRTPRLVLRRPAERAPVELRGRVLSRADRSPRIDHLVEVVAVHAVEGGSFRLRSDEGWVAHTDAEGSFAMRVPDAPLLDVGVWRAWEARGRVLEQTLELPVDGTLELLVP